jgi:prevent-host-death family protein
VETIGLRELNQNPSRAVARVRAGVTVVVTDRGRPILRMVPEVERPGLIPDLAPELDSLAESVVADRRRERGR